MKKLTKRLMVLLTSLIVLSGAYAAWTLFAEDTADLTVVSTDSTPISFTLFLGSEVITTTDLTSNATVTFDAVLDNLNGDRSLLIQSDLVKIDVEDDCFDYETDVASNVYLDDVQLIDWALNNGGITKMVTAGPHDVRIEMEVVPLSCPQLVEQTITFSEG